MVWKIKCENNRLDKDINIPNPTFEWGELSGWNPEISGKILIITVGDKVHRPFHHLYLDLVELADYFTIQLKQTRFIKLNLCIIC